LEAILDDLKAASPLTVAASSGSVVVTALWVEMCAELSGGHNLAAPDSWKFSATVHVSI
jgi:hypothetical protein